MIARLVSGGQTGVTRAALDAALELGVPYGGWCPKGRKAEDGRIEDRYPLAETPSPGYSQRHEGVVGASRTVEVANRRVPNVQVGMQDGFLDLIFGVSHGYRSFRVTNSKPALFLHATILELLAASAGTGIVASDLFLGFGLAGQRQSRRGR